PRFEVAQLPFRSDGQRRRNPAIRRRPVLAIALHMGMAMRSTARFFAGLTLTAALVGGCSTPADDISGTTTQPGGSAVPQDVKAIVFLQRKARNQGTGNVFDYTSYEPGARLVKLEPPAPGGTLTTITNDPMFASADIMSWDLSFDARTIV